MSEGNSHYLMAIGRHDGGSVIESLDDLMREVNRAVLTTGKKGEVTVKMAVEPNGEKGVKVGFTTSSKIPAVEHGESFYFVNNQLDLLRDPPKGEERFLLHMDGGKS